MKIIYIATGAANMYCGSCMHDNALAAALKAAGEDVSLFPLYTPMRLDEENVGERQIFYGGIEAYLMQKYPRPFPGRSFLFRVAGSQLLLRLMPHFDIGSAVDPKANAEMTISILKGEVGNQRELLQELVSWIKSTYQPDLIHITNTLLIGVAREFKRSLQIPVTCGLHGEDIFLEGMPPPYQDEALGLIRERAQDVDRFLAISTYYAEMYSNWVGLDHSKIEVVWPGIALEDYRKLAAEPAASHPLTIGFLARFVPEKGLHLLVDAFIRLVRSGEFPDLQLIAGGYLSRAYQTYIDGIRKTIKNNGLEDRIKLLGTLQRADKLNFFRQIDVFSVPATYREPKGISILEALASGVPVVQPNHGAYPEWINATQGGLLHRPHNSVDLAEKLAVLLRDAELRKRIGERAQQAAWEQFSSECMAANTLAVFQELCVQKFSFSS
ncbi:MAG TPA: glycosyltransferase family 4 protein [Anaerolineales bacterium]|nr:glycosyltransferase family 4 protein [Anaerolineales bacterium]